MITSLEIMPMNGGAYVLLNCTCRQFTSQHWCLINPIMLCYPAEYRSATAQFVILGYPRALASLLATGQKAGFFPTAAYPRLQYRQRNPPGRWKRVLPLHTVGRPPYPPCLAFIRDVRWISRYKWAESRKIKVLVDLGRRGSMCDSVKMDERGAGGSAAPEVVCRKWPKITRL